MSTREERFKVHQEWKQNVQNVLDTGLFIKIKLTENHMMYHQNILIPRSISKDIYVVSLINSNIILSVKSPFRNNEWFELFDPYVKYDMFSKQSLNTWREKRINVEDLLEKLEPELQSEIIFHLNLFR